MVSGLSCGLEASGASEASAKSTSAAVSPTISTATGTTSIKTSRAAHAHGLSAGRSAKHAKAVVHA